jgi:hypothetical protein
MMGKAPFRQVSISELEKGAIYAKSGTQATTPRRKELTGGTEMVRMKY